MNGTTVIIERFPKSLKYTFIVNSIKNPGQSKSLTFLNPNIMYQRCNSSGKRVFYGFIIPNQIYNLKSLILLEDIKPGKRWYKVLAFSSDEQKDYFYAYIPKLITLGILEVK